MAFRCRIWLKSECDGCGRCEDEDERPYGLSRGRSVFDDETDDPFEIDRDDERM